MIPVLIGAAVIAGGAALFGGDKKDKKPVTSVRVKKIIAEQLNLDKNKIQMSSRLVEDLGANFKDRLRIFNSLEEEFGIEFSGENYETVSDIVNYVKTASENSEPAQKEITVSQFKDEDVTVEKREVSEEYVLRQLSQHNGTINF